MASLELEVKGGGWLADADTVGFKGANESRQEMIAAGLAE